MPLYDTDLAQTQAEKERMTASQMLITLNNKLGKKNPNWLIQASKDYYCNENKTYLALYQTIESLAEGQLEKLVYNGRDPEARKLADWYDNYKLNEDKRIKSIKEEKQAQRQENTKRAISNRKNKLKQS